VHPKDLPPLQRPAPAQTGNANYDRKYERQQEKATHSRERVAETSAKLDQEHQRMERRQADKSRRQQVEQRHEQQTQQLQQRHMQEQQRMRER